MLKPTQPILALLHSAYVIQLLLLASLSLRAALENGILPCSISYAAAHLEATLEPKVAWDSILPPGPKYFVFDFTTRRHSSKKIEGVSQHYSNADKGLISGHKFASSCIISPKHNHLPIPFSLKLHTDKKLECSKITQGEKKPRNDKYYEYKTPVERIISELKKAENVKIEISGIVVDAEFTSKDNLNIFYENSINVIGRIRKNVLIEYEGNLISISSLANIFKFGDCTYCKKTKFRSKAIKVTIPGLLQEKVKIVIIWRKNGFHFLSLQLI